MEIHAKKTSSRELAKQIGSRIKAGEFAPGQRLCGIREIAERHQVSVAVARYCLETLKRQGLVIQRRGSGTYVNPQLRYGDTRLIGLLTTYSRYDIENYYEPLFEVAISKRVVPMIGVIGNHSNWRQTICDIVARDPDMLLLDVEARQFPREELRALLGSTPVCHCNRWEWGGKCTERAVLTDYVEGYAEGLRLLHGRGHERILFVGFHRQPRPYLRDNLRRALQAAGFEPDDARLLYVSRDEIMECPEVVNARIEQFAPTAMLAMSDYLVPLLSDKCPVMAALEKVGFFNFHHSRVPGAEFTSLDVDFGEIWRLALSSIDDPKDKQIQHVRPLPVIRW